MIRTLWNLLDHAKQRGFDPMRLWVHGCLIGKTKRYFNVRYHAKGRGSREKRDFCKVKVIMYEKDEQQFLTEIAEGKCAPGLANTVRRVLLER
jgi:ribosomal protein L22